MFVFHRLAALAIVASVLTPNTSHAVDDHQRALSSGPTELRLCGADSALTSSGACKETDYGALTGKIETALQASLAKAPANVRPLLKRDQAWFNEITLNAADTMTRVRRRLIGRPSSTTLRRRAATLEGIAQGFGRTGVAGRWVNTFGSVTVTADGRRLPPRDRYQRGLRHRQRPAPGMQGQRRR